MHISELKSFASIWKTIRLIRRFRCSGYFFVRTSYWRHVMPNFGTIFFYFQNVLVYDLVKIGAHWLVTHLYTRTHTLDADKRTQTKCLLLRQQMALRSATDRTRSCSCFQSPSGSLQLTSWWPDLQDTDCLKTSITIMTQTYTITSEWFAAENKSCSCSNVGIVGSFWISGLQK